MTVGKYKYSLDWMIIQSKTISKVVQSSAPICCSESKMPSIYSSEGSNRSAGGGKRVKHCRTSRCGYSPSVRIQTRGISSSALLPFLVTSAKISSKFESEQAVLP